MGLQIVASPLILLRGALRHYAFRQAEPMDSIVCPWKILVSLVELLNSLLNSLLNWNLFKCKIVRSEYVQPWHWLIGFLMSWLIVESKFGQSVFGELTICWKSTIVEVGFVLTDLSPLTSIMSNYQLKLIQMINAGMAATRRPPCAGRPSRSGSPTGRSPTRAGWRSGKCLTPSHMTSARGRGVQNSKWMYTKGWPIIRMVKKSPAPVDLVSVVLAAGGQLL